MIYGTHNSATGGKLVWWLRAIGGIINITSKCQNKSIKEQLKDNVKLFNLQVAFINNKWRFTHGLAIYKEDVFETIKLIKSYTTKDSPIYFQLYLDKCFWCKQNDIEFIKLINKIRTEYLDNNFMMFDPWIEGTNEYLKLGTVLNPINIEEHYWTLSWSKKQIKIIDKLPLPKYHAKKYNSMYKDKCNYEFLMLDYYNI